MAAPVSRTMGADPFSQQILEEGLGMSPIAEAGQAQRPLGTAFDPQADNGPAAGIPVAGCRCDGEIHGGCAYRRKASARLDHIRIEVITAARPAPSPTRLRKPFISASVS